MSDWDVCVWGLFALAKNMSKIVVLLRAFYSLLGGAARSAASSSPFSIMPSELMPRASSSASSCFTESPEKGQGAGWAAGGCAVGSLAPPGGAAKSRTKRGRGGGAASPGVPVAGWK